MTLKISDTAPLKWSRYLGFKWMNEDNVCSQIQWLRETSECSQQESDSSLAGFQSLHVIHAHCIIMLLFNLHVFWCHSIWRSYLVEKGVCDVICWKFFQMPVTYSCTICTLLCQLVIFNNLHVFLVWAFEGPMYTYMCCSGKGCTMWCHEFVGNFSNFIFLCSTWWQSILKAK